MIHYQNILLIFDSTYFTPQGHDFTEDFKDKDWVTERDIFNALQENGFTVTLIGLFDDISLLINEIKENPPDVVFNLTEVFKYKSKFDKNVAAVLEMLEIPYTGASPASMLICNDKALSKKVLTYHKVRTPKFHTYRRNRRIILPKRLNFPLVVKPLHEEASRGISQASVVDSEKALTDNGFHVRGEPFISQVTMRLEGKAF